jgi:hypothetical protein
MMGIFMTEKHYCDICKKAIPAGKNYLGASQTLKGTKETKGWKIQVMITSKSDKTQLCEACCKKLIEDSTSGL